MLTVEPVQSLQSIARNATKYVVAMEQQLQCPKDVQSIFSSMQFSYFYMCHYQRKSQPHDSHKDDENSETTSTLAVWGKIFVDQYTKVLQIVKAE